MNLVFHLLCNLCRSCFVAGWQDGTGPWRHQQPNLPRPRRNPRSSHSSTYRQPVQQLQTRGKACFLGLFNASISTFLFLKRMHFYVINSKKLSSQEVVSTDFGPNVTDQPRIFPAASIWSCTVASDLENASSLCSSKFNPIEISS